MQPKVCPFCLTCEIKNATFEHHMPSCLSYHYAYVSLLVPGISFVGRLFRHALEESRPKSVLVHSLSVCISLLDPKRLASASYQAFKSNLSHGTLVTASPETVDGMLESLGECSLIDPVKLLMLFVCFALVTLMFSTKCILFIMCTVIHLSTDMFSIMLDCLLRELTSIPVIMLGALLKLLDITSSENVLPTTYGCLRPPLGKHRLKVRFDAVNLLPLV